ncbi:prolyl oligopeptidase family serine peptidase [Embleya sp. NPDC050154]|uniref:prolyl oligopeptidase family serine peptidase n=1 Tax=Embleya sp. NPDC050154 TaxID=3363988 RepID=UPI0037A31788
MPQPPFPVFPSVYDGERADTPARRAWLAGSRAVGEALAPPSGDSLNGAFEALRSGDRTLPQRSGGWSFTIEAAVGSPGRTLFVTDPAGARRELLYPARPRSGVGIGRGGWVVGPPEEGDPRYLVICDVGETGADSTTVARVIDARTGKTVEVLDPAVHAVAFTGPREFVYERAVRTTGGASQHALYHHRIGSGTADRRLDLGDAFDPVYLHELAASADGRWLAVAECVALWGIGNKMALVSLESGQVHEVNHDRAHLTEATFDANGNLLLRERGRAGYGTLSRVELPVSGDRAHDIQSRLDRRRTLVPEEPGAQIIDYTPVEVDGREMIAVSRVRSGLLFEIAVVDPSGTDRPRYVDLPGPPVYEGDSERIVGAIGAVDGLATAPDGALLFTFGAWGRATETYRVDPAGGEPEAVTNFSRNVRARLSIPPMQGRLHHAASKDGTPVPYLVAEPQGLTGKALAVVRSYCGFAYLNRAAGDSAAGRQSAVALASGGRAVLPALRGTGGHGWDWFQEGHKANFGKNTEDARAVEQDLVTKGLADPRQIVQVVGSAGAMVGADLERRHPGGRGGVVFIDCDLDILDPSVADALMRRHAYGRREVPEEAAVLHRRNPITALLDMTVQSSAGVRNWYITQSVTEDRVAPRGAFQFVRTASAALRQGRLSGRVVFRPTKGAHSGSLSPRDQADIFRYMAQTTGHGGRPLLREAPGAGKDPARGPDVVRAALSPIVRRAVGVARRSGRAPRVEATTSARPTGPVAFLRAKEAGSEP